MEGKRKREIYMELDFDAWHLLSAQNMASPALLSSCLICESRNPSLFWAKSEGQTERIGALLAQDDQ